MITYTGRDGQPRRAIDPVHLIHVPLRRRATIVHFPTPAPCRACQSTGEVPRWDPEGGIFGDFLGMELCNCPAAAALIEEREAEAIAPAGGESAQACDDECPF